MTGTPKTPDPEPLVTEEELRRLIAARRDPARVISPMEYAARHVLYGDPVVKALVLAARTEEDWPKWLARTLASVAARLGSLAALTASHPDSPEADLVDRLARSAAPTDEDLDQFGEPPHAT